MVLNENEKLEISLPLRDQIADILRRKILSGELKSGDKISEKSLSEIYNVSTAPAKEAIRILNMEGLLRTYHRKGTFVTSPVIDNILQQVHLRSVVEGTAAYWGTKNITDDEIRQMAKYLTRFDYLIHNEDLTDAEVLDQIAKNNYHFHLVLSEAAQNEYLNHLIKNFGSINNTIRYMYYSSDLNSKDTLAEYEISLKEHSEIFEAVRLRQPEMAEALTVKHIKNVCKTVIAAQK